MAAMTDEQAKNYLRNNPKVGRVIAAKVTGLGRYKVQKLLKELKEGTKGESSVLPYAIDADEFKEQFDIPKKIKENLNKLEGKVITDSDFRIALGVNTTLWRRAADRMEFKEYQIQIKGRLYWAHPETIKEIKEKMDVL